MILPACLNLHFVSTRFPISIRTPLSPICCEALATHHFRSLEPGNPCYCASVLLSQLADWFSVCSRPSLTSLSCYNNPMQILRRSQQCSAGLSAVPAAKPDRRSKPSHLARVPLPSQPIASSRAGQFAYSSEAPLQRCAAAQNGAEGYTAGAIATQVMNLYCVARRMPKAPMYPEHEAKCLILFCSFAAVSACLPLACGWETPTCATHGPSSRRNTTCECGIHTSSEYLMVCWACGCSCSATGRIFLAPRVGGHDVAPRPALHPKPNEMFDSTSHRIVQRTHQAHLLSIPRGTRCTSPDLLWSTRQLISSTRLHAILLRLSVAQAHFHFPHLV